MAAERIGKNFGSLVALDDVSIEFAPGRIHAVLGENGAGKTTLMNILAGFLPPDRGRIRLEGQPVTLPSHRAAREKGIAMVHQHFMLVPQFSVEENLALSRLTDLRGRLSVAELTEPAWRLAQELGWDVPRRATTGQLPVGVQQRIEILKVLSGEARVLIFDEPTAVLSPDEVADLFRVLRRLRDAGKAILLIAHKLSEVMQVADVVSVLRRGRLVATAPITEVEPARLAAWMLGEEVSLDVAPNGAPDRGALVLEAEGLLVRGDRDEEAVRGATFAVHRGEILGLGGVDGNGQVELAEALLGIRPLAGGRLRTHPDEGRPFRIAYIPQDRQHDGLALSLSVAENFLIEGHRRPDLGWGPFLRGRKARVWAESLVRRFGIKVESVSDRVDSLSGGNQQKVVVSRALDSNPDLIVAVNPTRGLDFAASADVHRRLREAAAAGAGVVLFSTDSDELAALAHRTLYLDRGVLYDDPRHALMGSPR